MAIRNSLGMSRGSAVGISPMPVAGASKFSFSSTRLCQQHSPPWPSTSGGREAKAGGLKDVSASASHRLEPEQSGVTERSGT